jgi:hypothetical protein
MNKNIILLYNIKYKKIKDFLNETFNYYMYGKQLFC